MTVSGYAIWGNRFTLSDQQCLIRCESSPSVWHHIGCLSFLGCLDYSFFVLSVFQHLYSDTLAMFKGPELIISVIFNGKTHQLKLVWQVVHMWISPPWGTSGFLPLRDTTLLQFTLPCQDEDRHHQSDPYQQFSLPRPLPPERNTANVSN